MIPEQDLEPALADTRDFRETFHKFYPNVCRQLTYLLGDPAAAEDLAQETFLKLYQTPPIDRQNMGGWLARVAANLAYNHLRAGKRRKEREAGEVEESLSRVIPLDEAVAHRLEVRAVRSALNRLTARDRACLLLRYSGFSYAEIATAIGVPKNSVGTILARAQQHFRQIYEPRN